MRLMLNLDGASANLSEIDAKEMKTVRVDCNNTQGGGRKLLTWRAYFARKMPTEVGSPEQKGQSGETQHDEKQSLRLGSGDNWRDRRWKGIGRGTRADKDRREHRRKRTAGRCDGGRREGSLRRKQGERPGNVLNKQSERRRVREGHGSGHGEVGRLIWRSR